MKLAANVRRMEAYALPLVALAGSGCVGDAAFDEMGARISRRTSV